MKFTSKVGIHNEFDIEVKDIRTGEIRQRGKAYNILLDRIYTRLCNRQSFFDSISFGRGTDTLDQGRTTLFNQIASLTATTVEEVRDVANNVYYRKRKVVLLPANYVGETITEVGVSYRVSSTDYICSHALIQDSEGNQIAIGPKTEFDEITIYATVYFQLFDNGNIKWASLPNSNALLNYLFSGTLATTPVIQVGQSRLQSLNSAILSGLASKNSAYTADIPNKKLKVNTVTFRTTEGNGDVFEVGLGSILRAQFPVPGIWNGYNVTGEVVGTGDGNESEFNFKNSQINSVSAVYIDGQLKSEGTDYLIGKFQKSLGVINVTKEVSSIGGLTESNIIKIFDRTNVSIYNFSDNSGPWEIMLSLHENEYEDFVPNTIGYVVGSATSPYGRITSMQLLGSNDMDSWDVLSIYSNGEWSVLSLSIGRRYYKFEILSVYGGRIPSIRNLYLENGKSQLKFTTPPSSGAVVTADYSIEQIPKDENHTLTVGFEIQWGEGGA